MDEFRKSNRVDRLKVKTKIEGFQRCVANVRNQQGMFQQGIYLRLKWVEQVIIGGTFISPNPLKSIGIANIGECWL